MRSSFTDRYEPRLKSQAAGDAEGEDAVAKLEAALRPIEKYAVRLLEEVRPILKQGIPELLPLTTSVHLIEGNYPQQQLRILCGMHWE